MEKSRVVIVALELTFLFREKENGEEEEEGHAIWPECKGMKLESSSPWQSLPSDLLFSSILVRLPFPCLLRLRRVSHSWRFRLSSSAFWRSWFSHSLNHDPNSNNGFRPLSKAALQTISTSCISPCALECLASGRDHYVPCLVLCSALPRASLHGHAARWVKQKSVKYVRSGSRGCAPCVSHRWFYLHENFMQMQRPYTILASEKGILLLMLRGTQSDQLVVCNPLLGGQRVLPMPTFPLFISSARLFVDAEREDYVVILSDGQAYHSKTGKWEEIPRMLHAGEEAELPSLMDGSIFWISHQRLSGSNDLVLSAYHPTEKLVTSVLTHSSHEVYFPKCGFVWKDSQGLLTLAADATWFGIWKFDNGLWKKLKELMAVVLDVSELIYVKVGNLLVIKERWVSRFYVFNFQLQRGAWSPPCPLLEHLIGCYGYQPFYLEV